MNYRRFYKVAYYKFYGLFIPQKKKSKINLQTGKFLINMPIQLLNQIVKCNPLDVCRPNITYMYNFQVSNF